MYIILHHENAILGDRKQLEVRVLRNAIVYLYMYYMYYT